MTPGIWVRLPQEDFDRLEARRRSLPWCEKTSQLLRFLIREKLDEMDAADAKKGPKERRLAKPAA